MHRILVADDHSIVREALKSLIVSFDGDHEVVEASNHDELVKWSRDSGSIDLVMLDLTMPGMPGARHVPDVVEMFRGAPVVVVSAREDQATVLEALRNGASGFVPKSLSSQAMRHALGLILSGERYFPSVLMNESTDGRRGKFNKNFSKSNPLHQLSDWEAEILECVINGESNKTVARKLNLSENTVKVHLRNCYRKLGSTNRAGAVRVAMENGWGETAR